MRYPHDALVVRLTNFMHFYTNGGAAMRQSSSLVIGAWDEDRPDFGYMLGVHAFSLEEAGDHETTEAVGKRAVEIND